MPQPIHDLFVALTYPPAFSLCLLMAGILARAVRWRRLAIALIALAFGWSLLWSIPWCSERLRATLEDRFPVVEERALPQADAIVVLGGGSVRGVMRADVAEALASDHSRLAAGARAWLAGRAPLVVLSGGGNRTSEAARMAVAIKRLGVPASAVILEERSSNTRDNARFTAQLTKSRGVERILLVTSAVHMPRAVVWFRAAGFEVVPVPTLEPKTRPGWRAWLPNPHALWRSGRAIKELAGLAAAHAETESSDSRPGRGG
jgi:uncharacterized SAM-binding protein YcdF (DUF218 family)